MAKKKSTAVQIVEQQTADNTRAAILAVIPAELPVDALKIVNEVLSFKDEAQKALAVAQRADVNGADPAGNAGDVLRAIGAARARLETARKSHTAGLDSLKANIMGFYSAPDKVYAEAQTTLKSKIDVWRRAEEDRLTREAEERRRARDEEARRLAAAQAALGDAEGATQILEEAAAVSSEPEKVRAVGVYGATVGSISRNVGYVDDRFAFFKALATSQDPAVKAIADDIVFPQALLNKLAKLVNDGESLCPPGFRAGKVDSSNIR